MFAWRYVGVLLVCVFAIDHAIAQETDSADARRNEKLLALCKAELGEFEFNVKAGDGTADDEIKLIPLLNWTNPARDQVQIGYMGMWTFQGKPVAVGTVFCFPSPSHEPGFMFVHEFHALTLHSMSAKHQGANFWTPKEPAYKPETFPSADVPSPQSPTQRLRQMRGLAERFSGHSVDKEKQKYQLRLLPKPLYRYESKVGDGAIFAMVSDNGTDPEVLLIIEADRLGPEGQWRYGVARYSDHNLFVSLDGAQVWTFEKGGVWPAVDCGPGNKYRLREYRTIPTPGDEPEETGGKPKKTAEKAKNGEKAAKEPPKN